MPTKIENKWIADQCDQCSIGFHESMRGCPCRGGKGVCADVLAMMLPAPFFLEKKSLVLHK